MLAMMGPADIGDVNGPTTYVADSAAQRCHRCQRLWESHEMIRTASRSYAHCPE